MTTEIYNIDFTNNFRENNIKINLYKYRRKIYSYVIIIGSKDEKYFYAKLNFYIDSALNIIRNINYINITDINSTEIPSPSYSNIYLIDNGEIVPSDVLDNDFEKLIYDNLNIMFTEAVLTKNDGVLMISFILPEYIDNMVMQLELSNEIIV